MAAITGDYHPVSPGRQPIIMSHLAEAEEVVEEGRFITAHGQGREVLWDPDQAGLSIGSRSLPCKHRDMARSTEDALKRRPCFMVGGWRSKLLPRDGGLRPLGIGSRDWSIDRRTEGMHGRVLVRVLVLQLGTGTPLTSHRCAGDRRLAHRHPTPPSHPLTLCPRALNSVLPTSQRSAPSYSPWRTTMTGICMTRL